MQLWPFKKKSSQNEVARWVTAHLAVSHAPMSYDQLDRLKEAGIDAILNLCAEFPDLPLIEQQAGFEVYYLPVEDEETPEMEAMDNALEWMDEAIFLGKKVLVHCRHGIGRTGTLASAYLLRKGFSPKLAQKKLSPLRSRPANYDQWSLLRKYGKKQGGLKMREPSLEQKQVVDLAPFFQDLEAIFRHVDERIADQKLCGRDHMRCCGNRVMLSLVEAVYVSHKINTLFDRDKRHGLIQKAVKWQAKPEFSKNSGELGGEEFLCPLNHNQACTLFEHRPLACRLFDSPELGWEKKEGLHEAVFAVSQSMFLAFGGRFLEQDLQLELTRVVSGKYVQDFFTLLMRTT
ncbi:MAG: protein-tyrosine phosphatase family protein [Thermodesulfobacteriota bacterium]